MIDDKIQELIKGLQEVNKEIITAFAKRVLKDALAYENEFIKGLLEAGVTEPQIVYAILSQSTAKCEKELAEFFKEGI